MTPWGNLSELRESSKYSKRCSVNRHWINEYPGIATKMKKIHILPINFSVDFPLKFCNLPFSDPQRRNAWGGGGRLDEYFLLASTFPRSTNAHEDPRRSGTARTWYWWYPLAISPSMAKFHLWSPGLLRSCWKWEGRCSSEMSRELFFEQFLGSSECSNRFKGRYMQIHGNTICSKSTYRYCKFKRFGHSDALRSKPECCHLRVVVVKPASVS